MQEQTTKTKSIWLDEWAVRSIGKSQEEQWHVMRWLGYNPVKCMQEGMRIDKIAFCDMSDSKDEVANIVYINDWHYDADPKEFHEIMLERHGGAKINV